MSGWDLRAARPWFAIAAALIAADQWTKALVAERFALYESLPLLPVLDLTRLHNTGAAFSMLADQSGWQRWVLTAIALGVSALLAVLLLRIPRGQPRALTAAYALVMAGALGNALDRIRFGYVVDFVHLHWQDWYYPAFNVADSAITVGALLLLWDAFRARPGAA
jgi:signal peptidase II